MFVAPLGFGIGVWVLGAKRTLRAKSGHRASCLLGRVPVVSTVQLCWGNAWAVWRRIKGGTFPRRRRQALAEIDQDIESGLLQSWEQVLLGHRSCGKTWVRSSTDVLFAIYPSGMCQLHVCQPLGVCGSCCTVVNFPSALSADSRAVVGPSR